METNPTITPTTSEETGGSAQPASAPAEGVVDNNDYSVSPAIAAATRGTWSWVPKEAERIRRQSKTAMGGGEASDLESQLANKIRTHYGENVFQNLDDRKVIEAYRRVFMPKQKPETAVDEMRKQYLPHYIPPKPQGLLEMAGGLVHGFVDDFVEKPLFAVGASLQAIKSNAELQSSYEKLARLKSSGVSADDPAFKAVQAEYDDALARTHGATQILGPSLAGAAAAYSAGKFLKIGSRIPGVGGLFGAAEGAGGKLFAKALESASGKTKWAIQHLAIPSVHTGLFMAEWEGFKDLYQGDFKDIPKDMWGGFMNGAMQGPAFHALGVGAGKARQTWMDAFPNAATAAMKDGGAALLEKFKYDTRGTIRDFKIDFRPVEGLTTEQSIRAQVTAMLDKLYGGGTASGTGTKLVDDLTAHFVAYAEKNPEIKLVPPTRDVRQMPGDPNPWKPTPETPSGEAAPQEDLPTTVVDIDGQEKKIRSKELGWSRLKKIYLEINELVNPKLKEALYRELEYRKNGQIPAEEKIPPPKSRAGTVDPASVRNERDVPEGWGSSPLDVYFNPDVPMSHPDKPEVAGAVDVGPRWRQEQGAAEEPLYGPRMPTYRDMLADMARQLVRQIHADRNLPDPTVSRPHPGWGTPHIVQGEAAPAELKATVDLLNQNYGPQSAEIVYDTGRAAGIRLNRELEEHFARGQTTPYIGWGTAGVKTTQETALRNLTAMLKMLGMGSERVGVKMPSGRVQMYTAEEYAQELLEAAQRGAKPGDVDPRVVESKQAEWLRNTHHEEALREDAARSHGEALQEEVSRSYDAATKEEVVRSHEQAIKEEKARAKLRPKPSATPTPRVTAAEPPRPSGPYEAFILTIGEPKLNNNGFPIQNVRMLLGKQFKTRMNKAGDAVELGAPNHMLALPQLKAMLESADKHGVAVERIFNETPQYKSQIKALTDNGFKKVGNVSGATIFRREPVPPGTVTKAEVDKIPAVTPTIVNRTVGKPPGQALTGSGNVVPGTPAVRPSPAGAQTNLFDPNK